jgi:adenine-specific DNA-methyltransferase
MAQAAAPNPSLEPTRYGNTALKSVKLDVRQKLADKLAGKQKHKGKRAVTEADRHRWTLPKDACQEWEIPFHSDPDWPQPVQEALAAYRAAWRSKMDQVNGCIAANAEMEEVIDKPEEAKGIVRVAGPFTVEGVRPGELSLGKSGLFDPTPNGLSAAASPRRRQFFSAATDLWCKFFSTS